MIGAREYKTPSARSHVTSVGTHYRSALNLLTMANSKTPKSEHLGYLSAILYLMPHESGGGPSLCPHSTEACREMCLAGAGLSGLPKQLRAKQNRTDAFLGDRGLFLADLDRDIAKLTRIAKQEGLRPAVRLNGTSDVLWERLELSLMGEHPTVRFYDYTKIPLEKRQNLPANYHLTYSIEGPESMARAAEYLRAGKSVAAVVDVEQKARLLDTGGAYVDGDAHDLRFLDPPGSIVLLKPKGHVRTSLMRADLERDLADAALVFA